MSNQKTVVIAGAGPAGLTAAYELLSKTQDYKVIVLEKTETIGGISQTAVYKDNRIDIGGHRFFSKNSTVMNWWDNMLTKEGDPDETDDIMLTRSRLSRIYYERKFFDYPITLNWKTIKNLGRRRTIKAGFSYLKSVMHKVPEENLEGFYINRFGQELYNTFFRDYTAKLWGISPSEIDSSWGAQRVKGISIAKVLINALGLAKEKETSLIDKFYYPKLGPGYLWEKTAREVEKLGGEVLMQTELIKINASGSKISSVHIKDHKTGETKTLDCDYFLSTVPIPEVINDISGVEVPDNIKKVAEGLLFRDFITVGILADKLKMETPDNWIYIQEPDVTVCRLQIFNNWSPYMLSKDAKDKNLQWIGMEYVVSDKDDIWRYDDEKMSKFGVDELVKIGIIDKENVQDTCVIHINKAYPAYFGTYQDFPKVREFLDGFENLFCLGRNGQHRYNNMDHSMLTAIEAVNNIINEKLDKSNVWNVNTEKEYHEES